MDCPAVRSVPQPKSEFPFTLQVQYPAVKTTTLFLNLTGASMQSATAVKTREAKPAIDPLALHPILILAWQS